MVLLKKVKSINKDILERVGLQWHTDPDGSPYISDEVILISEKEAENYYQAANEIYNMMIEAGEYIIQNNLFNELEIPFNLIDIIKISWENDEHWHLYGRFDFAGGVDGKEIKLIEFNSDTPTGLVETAVIQWLILKYNDFEEKQFNNVYETILNNFKQLDTSKKILFSSYDGSLEEIETVKLLENIAKDAGFETSFEFLHRVQFSEEGIFDANDNRFEYWFKLFPWENIGFEEPNLVALLNQIYKKNRAIILNPPYTLLFQSKGILKILYDLFPNSPYLLKTDFKPLKNIKQVEKKMFGREGANTKIYDENGNCIKKTDGEYENYKSIFQEYYEFPQDEFGNSYQAGVFFAFEGAGLGFRRGNKILDNMSKFVGHVII